MSIYWNHFVINVDNKTAEQWSFAGAAPTAGTIQVSGAIPSADSTSTVYIGRSSSDSTAGASGTANWTSPDQVVLEVTYNAPNTGDPSMSVSLSGTNQSRYTVDPDGSATSLPCDGSGCPINSGYRLYTGSITISKS